MFHIIYTPFYKNTHYGDYESLRGVILAARENGAIVYQWDETSKTWREV